MSEQFTFSKEDLTSRARELYLSGRPVAFLVGDELSVYERRLKAAGKLLSEEAEARGGRPVQVVIHDRWCGFRLGLPDIPACTNKTNQFGTALQLAMMTREEILKFQEKGKQNLLEPWITKPDGKREANPDYIQFNPEDDIIFVFLSVDEELKTQPLVLTLLRDIIQSNATSTDYVEQKQNGKRGSRMLVMISASMDMPQSIPELKPEVIPLPSHKDLQNIVEDIFVPMWEDFEQSKGSVGTERFDDSVRDKIVSALIGMTSQDAEETLALACVRHEVLWHHKIADLNEFLSTIEDEKGKVIAKDQGMRYIPKKDIVKVAMPGYERARDFVRQRLRISPEEAAKYKIQPIRGMAVGGRPGVAKTEFAKFLARETNRVAIIVNVGDLKGSLVGQSEQNLRRALQRGRALHALIIWDDIDKGSMGGAAKSYGGDGGTTGNMIGSLLTDMSDPTSEIMHVFTFNRVPDLPEILRPGRMDKLYFVEAPNATTRLAIFKDHIARWGMTIDDEEKLESLAGLIDGYTGAEIAHVLVKEEGIRCVADKETVMKAANMVQAASTFTPMSKMKTFMEDVAAMEEACSQFERIGNIPDSHEEPAAAASTGQTRGRRRVSA